MLAVETAMVQRRATYQDLLDAPENLVAELIDGELLLSPQPRMGHQVAASMLVAILIDAFQRRRAGANGWLIVAEPELHLAREQRVLVPDLAGWRRERTAAIEMDHAAVEVVPDWICEVLSPSTSRLDRLRKLPLYAEHGVAWVWLLDPLARSLEIYRREPEGYLLPGAHGDEAKLHAAPFDAIELDLKELWPEASPALEPR